MIHIEDSVARELKRRRTGNEEGGGVASTPGHTPRGCGRGSAKTPGTAATARLASGKTPGKTPRKVRANRALITREADTFL